MAAGGEHAEQVKQHRHEIQFTVHTGRRALAHGGVSQGCRSMLRSHPQRHGNTPPIVEEEDTHKEHEWQVFIGVYGQSGRVVNGHRTFGDPTCTVKQTNKQTKSKKY